MNRATYSKIINLGISEISTNDSLSAQIYNYYGPLYDSSQVMDRFEDESSNLQINYFYYGEHHVALDNFELQSNGIDSLPSFVDPATNRNRIIQLITEPPGRNYLITELQRKYWLIDFFQNRNAAAAKLISAIDEELADMKP